MFFQKIRHCLPIVYLIFMSQCTKAATSVIVYGTDVETGGDVLASLELPDKAFDDAQQNLELLQVTVIARNVTLPNQGSNSSILYWKWPNLWRYQAGKYYLIQDDISSATSVSKAIESPFGKGSEPIAHERSGALEILFKQGQEYDSGPYAFTSPQGELKGVEPIGWLRKNALLARQWRMDIWKRPMWSKLIIYTFDNKPRTKKEINDGVMPKVEQTSLTALPEATLELGAAVNGNAIAIQTLEGERNFRIGVMDSTTLNKKIQWLSEPKNENGRSEELERYPHRMEWSPDNSLLAVFHSFSLEGEGTGSTYLWDAKSKDWVKRKAARHHSYTTGRLFFLSSERIISFDTSGHTKETLVSASHISLFPANSTIIGRVKGILVKRIFNDNLLNDQEK